MILLLINITTIYKMKIIRRKKDLKKLIMTKKSFSFIPTMGGLHKGHEFLIKKAQPTANW